MIVTIANIRHLRNMTGAGVIDCKNALNEAEGNYDRAMEIIRKKGRAVVVKRENCKTSEGCVLAASKGNFASIISVKCETDFVAKGEDFIDMVKKILNATLEYQPKTVRELNDLFINKYKVYELIINRIGISGEKMELGSYEYLKASTTVAYTHPGSKLAAIVGFNQEKVDAQVAKDIAMQVAAMNPIGLDKNSIPVKNIEIEKDIAREKAIKQGKPEAILSRIVEGALDKYYKECALLLQNFLKDTRITINDYLKKQNKELTVLNFRRVSLM